MMTRNIDQKPLKNGITITPIKKVSMELSLNSPNTSNREKK